MARADESPADRARRLAALDVARRAFSALSEGTISVSDSTQSMAPLLWGGEQLFWKRPEQFPRRGDLVVFIQPPGLIVHRAMARPRGGLLATKGDNRPTLDRPRISLQDVLGVVAHFERDGKRFSLETRRARLFAELAWACSACGCVVHFFAAAGDALLGRVAPRLRDRWVFRSPAWWVQRTGRLLLHRALFRLCHPALEAR